MFKKETMEKVIECKRCELKVVVEELGFLENSEYNEFFQKMRAIELDMDLSVNAKPKKGAKTKTATQKKRIVATRIKNASIVTRSNTLLLEAFKVATITIDDEPLKDKDVDMFVKTIGPIQAAVLFYEIMAIGELKEDEGKK